MLMNQRRRPGFTAAEKAELWDRWKRPSSRRSTPRVSLLGVMKTSIERLTDKKNPVHGRVFSFLVAGARLSNYMQIDMEPFPLVA